MPRTSKHDRDGCHRRKDRGGRYQITWQAVDPITGMPRRYTRLLDTTNEKVAQLERARAMLGMQEATKTPISNITLEHFAEKYLEAHAHQKDIVNKRHRIKSRILPKLGGRPLETLTPNALVEFRSELIGDKEGAARLSRQATANKYVKLVQHMIQWGVDEGLVDEKVLFAARKVKMLGESRGRVVFFYKSKLKLLFARAAEPGEYDGYLLPLIVLAAGTGIRRGDLLKLRWSDVDTGDEAGCGITVGGSTGYDTKGGKSHMVELGGLARMGLSLAREWLVANAKPATPDDWIIDWRSRDRIVYLVKRDFPKLLVGAGIDSRLTFHTLRHTFGTFALANGENIVNVKEWMGHSSILTTQRYLHAVPRQQVKPETVNPLARNSDAHFRKVCYQLVTNVLPLSPRAS